MPYHYQLTITKTCQLTVEANSEEEAKRRINPNNLDWSDNQIEMTYNIELVGEDDSIPEVIATLSNEITLDEFELDLSSFLKDFKTETLVRVALCDNFESGFFILSIIDYLTKIKKGQDKFFNQVLETTESNLDVSLRIEDRDSFLDYLLFHRRSELSEDDRKMLEDLLIKEEDNGY